MGGAISSSSSSSSPTAGDSIGNAYADNRNSISNVNNRYTQTAADASYQEAVSAVMGSSGSVVIETEVINSTEYATVAQVEKASQASARQARAEVFAEMQNSVGIRKRVGI